MLGLHDIAAISVASLREHKLRGALTVLGLTVGVATLITVMTIVQGANLYVEQKIANLGTNVFQIARSPLVPTDWELVIRSLRFKNITLDDMLAIRERCVSCEQVGGEAQTRTRARRGDKELMDTQLIGQTSNMQSIDTRSIVQGRYFTEIEDRRSVPVCVVGHKLIAEFFPGIDPLGKTIRVADQEFTIIGVYDEIGSVLGQEQDNFAIIPMNSWLRLRGSRTTITISVKSSGVEGAFERAQDEAKFILRTTRQSVGSSEDTFFIGTKESYMTLWRNISSAFFAVFVMVSSISAVVGGIVIMNVMLVSVTERTKEIGIRRAMGALQSDIRNQFLSESLIQCLVGGALGIAAGFGIALVLRSVTAFPAAVRPWVVAFGFLMSSGIGLLFGIYPATRAARLDPVEAMRQE